MPVIHGHIFIIPQNSYVYVLHALYHHDIQKCWQASMARLKVVLLSSYTLYMQSIIDMQLIIDIQSYYVYHHRLDKKILISISITVMVDWKI